uniref:Transmembrane protein n=1 Tax=Glossina austeni TaxID=7395 RepID=A0A1A9UZK1_GLOAU
MGDDNVVEMHNVVVICTIVLVVVNELLITKPQTTTIQSNEFSSSSGGEVLCLSRINLDSLISFIFGLHLHCILPLAINGCSSSPKEIYKDMFELPPIRSLDE